MAKIIKNSVARCLVGEPDYPLDPDLRPQDPYFFRAGHRERMDAWPHILGGPTTYQASCCHLLLGPERASLDQALDDLDQLMDDATDALQRGALSTWLMAQ